MGCGAARTYFTSDDDSFLAKYIARYNPEKAGRLGNALYKALVENSGKQWPWSSRHSWQSWRERYRTNESRFDHEIKQYQKKHGIRAEVDADAIKYARSVKVKLRTAKNNVDVEEETPAVKKKEKAAVAVPSTSRESHARKAAARKTANATRRTEESGGHPGEEEEDSFVEERRLPARRVERELGKEEEGEEEEEEEEEEATHKRKAGDESEMEGEAKRRRIGERPSGAEANGHIVEKRHRGKPSYNSIVAKQQRQGEGTVDGDMHDGAKESKGEGLASPATDAHTDHLPATKVPRTDEIITALKVLALHVDAGRRARIFKELEISEETQAYVTGYSEPAFPVAEPSSPKNTENTDSYQPLYPDLSEHINQNGSPSKSEAIPGDLDNASVSSNVPTRTTTDEKAPLDFTNGNSRSVESSDYKTSSASHKAVLQSSMPPGPQTRISNAKNDEYFATPTLSPAKQAPSHSHPSPSNFTPVTQNGTQATMKTTSPVSGKREPPRIVNDGFTTTYARANGRRAASYKRAPDLNSDSDFESGDSELESIVQRPAATPSWPPQRVKKVVQRNGGPVAASAAVVSVPEAREEHAESVKNAHIALFSTKAYREPVERTEESAGDKGHADLQLPNEPGSAPQAGPSRRQTQSLSLSAGKKAEEVDAWRLHTPALNDPDSSMIAASDPFVTADLANRLRREEKGKDKERAPTDADAKAARRMTFGGFSALTTNIPEFDLRKKALGRSSLAANLSAPVAHRSLSSGSSVRDRYREAPMSRRTSLASTIDLTADFPSPGVAIPPTDQVLVNRAGMQFFMQAMAQNHGMAEEIVRRVYEQRRDLPGTDRVLAEMRAAAERAFDEAMEREERENKMTESVSKTVSGKRHLYSSTSSQSNSDERERTRDWDRTRELDLSVLLRPNVASSGSRPRTELIFTPADEDETLARARARYVPPSTTRAARYVRKRARASLGMSSPLKPNVGEREVQGTPRNEEDGDDEGEEEEVSMSLMRPQALADVLGPTNGAGHIQGVPVTPTPASSNAKGASGQLPWTAEEDLLLSRGEDDEAIKEIAKRRGQAVVKQRVVELMMRDDHDLFS